MPIKVCVLLVGTNKTLGPAGWRIFLSQSANNNTEVHSEEIEMEMKVMAVVMVECVLSSVSVCVRSYKMMVL